MNLSEEKMKQAIANYILFNQINQSNPTLFVDFREENLYYSCHFRNAHLVTIEVCERGGLMNALSHVSKRNKFMLVFVVDDSVDLAQLQRIISHSELCVSKAASSENKEPLPTLSWSNFTSVEFVNFQTFFDLYPIASSLYEGQNYPGKRIFKHYSSEIVPNFLFLGSFYDATDEVIMTEMRITHVVDATSEHMSAKTCASLGISYLHIPVWDMEGVDIAQYFDTVLDFVHTARVAQGRILIHCRAGISRSSTLVLVYLMHSGHARSLQEALKIVVTERPYVLPNPSFRAQLSDYEESLFGTRSFPTDAEMLAFISTINFCWSGIFSAETDFDRIPIIAAAKNINSARLLDEYASPETEAALSNKPKKPFLKRSANVSGGSAGADQKTGDDAGAVPVVPARAKSSFVRPQVSRVKNTTEEVQCLVVGGSSGVRRECSDLEASNNAPVGSVVVEGAAGTGACAVKALRSPTTGRKVLSSHTDSMHSAENASSVGELVHSVVRRVIGHTMPPTPPNDAELGKLLRDWRVFGEQKTCGSVGVDSSVADLPPAH